MTDKISKLAGVYGVRLFESKERKKEIFSTVNADEVETIVSALLPERLKINAGIDDSQGVLVVFLDKADKELTQIILFGTQEMLFGPVCLYEISPTNQAKLVDFFSSKSIVLPATTSQAPKVSDPSLSKIDTNAARTSVENAGAISMKIEGADALKKSEARSKITDIEVHRDMDACLIMVRSVDSVYFRTVDITSPKATLRAIGEAFNSIATEFGKKIKP